MQNRKVWGYLGLAARAGKAVSGSFCVERSVRRRRAKLVIVSQEASENTKKTFRDLCTYYKVPVYFYSDKETLGAAIGKVYRASVAVTDEGFGKAIEDRLRDDYEKMNEEKKDGGSKYGKNQSK